MSYLDLNCSLVTSSIAVKLPVLMLNNIPLTGSLTSARTVLTVNSGGQGFPIAATTAATESSTLASETYAGQLQLWFRYQVYVNSEYTSRRFKFMVMRKAQRQTMVMGCRWNPGQRQRTCTLCDSRIRSAILGTTAATAFESGGLCTDAKSKFFTNRTNRQLPDAFWRSFYILLHATFRWQMPNRPASTSWFYGGIVSLPGLHQWRPLLWVLTYRSRGTWMINNAGSYVTYESGGVKSWREVVFSFAGSIYYCSKLLGAGIEMNRTSVE